MDWVEGNIFVLWSRNSKIKCSDGQIFRHLPARLFQATRFVWNQRTANESAKFGISDLRKSWSTPKLWRGQVMRVSSICMADTTSLPCSARTHLGIKCRWDGGRGSISDKVLLHFHHFGIVGRCCWKASSQEDVLLWYYCGKSCYIHALHKAFWIGD